MYEFFVTPEMLLVIVAGLLAFVFDYFPGIAKKFDGFSESTKKLINLGLIFLMAIGIFVGACYGMFITNLVCSVKGFLDLIGIVLLAVGINYSVHKATKPSETLKARMFKRANPDLA